MYEELVKRLRYKAGWDESGVLEQAADAIEELMRYVQQMQKLRQEGWYLQKTEMMACGQAVTTMPLPEPPKEDA